MIDPLFEVCLQGVDDIIAARAGGAQRVELCSALIEGGLTPSWGTIEEAADLGGIDVMVMIRPRGGDFDYTPREISVMEKDIRRCQEIGVKGVVFGVLDSDGSVATIKIRRLIQAAGSMDVTFHRAFDVCRDPMLAMQQLADLGVSRILTSGQRATVPQGLQLLSKLIEAAPAGMTILPGCGITPENLEHILKETNASEFHATAFKRVESRMEHRNEDVYMGVPGLPEYEREVTCADEVRRFVQIAASLNR